MFFGKQMWCTFCTAIVIGRCEKFQKAGVDFFFLRRDIRILCQNNCAQSAVWEIFLCELFIQQAHTQF